MIIGNGNTIIQTSNSSRITSAGNVIDIKGNKLIINDQIVPQHLIKGKIASANSNVISVGSKTSVKLGRNKIDINGETIIVNGVDLKDATVQKENSTNLVATKEKDTKTKKQLIKKINQEKNFSKSFLKLADVETLKQIDNSMFTADKVGEQLLFMSKAEQDKLGDSIFDESSDRYSRNAHIGLPMGVASTIGGVVSLAAGSIFGGALMLAGAGLFLGTSIPRVIEEKKILKANKTQAMQTLKMWLPDLNKKEETDSKAYDNNAEKAGYNNLFGISPDHKFKDDNGREK